jgi:coenzyme Q-binding protein COQ10
LPSKNIKKNFNYSVDLLEKLVLDIDLYKEFLPWCNNSTIISKVKKENKLEIVADLEIGYSFAKDTYRSLVEYDNKNKKIVVSAIDGPVKNLKNIWIFKEISKNQCEISFFIDLELKNFLLNKMLSKFFDLGFNKILNSFESRAEYLNNLNN